MKKAYLAGGCFWGLEELFRQQTGIVDTEVGYSGGENEHPTYRNHPGHAEAIEITYDPSKTTYLHILDLFFRFHDPTTLNRQGNDRGTSYRSTIFYKSEQELELARSMISRVNESGRWEHSVVTTLEPFKAFTPAEPEHQDYLQRNPKGYTCHFDRGGSYLNEKTRS